MPTYLTPGVYVEEVPSAQQANRGRQRLGCRVCRPDPWWSRQHTDADLELDPVREDLRGSEQPGQRALHGGHVHGALRVRLLPERRLELLDRPGRRGQRRRREAQAALPAAADKNVEAFRAQALAKVEGSVEVELTEEPKADGGDATYKLVVTAGSESEEYEGLTLKKGRNNIATKVNASSKLIKIEDTGASLPEAQRVPATGKFALSAPAQEPSEVNPTHFSGDEARRKGMGALSAIDEVTMVLMPDLFTLGNDTQVRDLQGKMIAHCENMGDRMAILDSPPDLLPQEILEWRMNTAGYDSKMSALYYPWIEVRIR